MDDTLTAWFVWLFASLLLVGYCVRIIPHWSDAAFWERAETGMAPLRFMGTSFVRAIRRGGPSGALGVAASMVGLGLSGVIGEQPSPVIKTLFVVMFTLVLSNFVLVLLVNRPRFLVPPSLRAETGPVVEWFRQQREGYARGRRGK